MPVPVCGPQDLQLALEKVRSALLEREERLKEAEQQWRQSGEEQALTIRELRASLLARDQLREVLTLTLPVPAAVSVATGQLTQPDSSLSSKARPVARDLVAMVTHSRTL